MSYKNAFNCKKCPGNNTPDGCPMWWEIVETNLQSGEERITKDCGYVLMPRFMTATIQAGNRPAAAIESFRNAFIHAMQDTNQNRLELEPPQKNGADR
jgi:hypothetical protein